MSQFEVKQVVAEVDGQLVIVALGEADLRCIADLICSMAMPSAVKVYKLPGLKMLPFSEVFDDQV